MLEPRRHAAREHVQQRIGARQVERRALGLRHLLRAQRARHVARARARGESRHEHVALLRLREGRRRLGARAIRATRATRTSRASAFGGRRPAREREELERTRAVARARARVQRRTPCGRSEARATRLPHLGHQEPHDACGLVARRRGDAAELQQHERVGPHRPVPHGVLVQVDRHRAPAHAREPGHGGPHRVGERLGPRLKHVAPGAKHLQGLQRLASARQRIHHLAKVARRLLFSGSAPSARAQTGARVRVRASSRRQGGRRRGEGAAAQELRARAPHGTSWRRGLQERARALLARPV